VFVAARDLRGSRGLTEIHDNLIATSRMLERLEADPYFQVENLNDLDARIPIILWVLCVRATDGSGKMQIIKGAHYLKTALKIRDAIDSDGARLFRIAGRIICARFSEDLGFDAKSEYRMDCNKAEISVYPVLLDGGAPWSDMSSKETRAAMSPAPHSF
jgi:hypothetical protein